MPVALIAKLQLPQTARFSSGKVTIVFWAGEGGGFTAVLDLENAGAFEFVEAFHDELGAKAA